MVNPGPTPHVGGPILPTGCQTVIIGGMPATRVGDRATCNGPCYVIVSGAPCVIIGGMPAARLGDATAHGGVVTSGCPTVLIGDECPTAVESSIGPEISHIAGPCDEKIRIIDAVSGLPIEGYPYYIENNNNEILSGRTDSHGEFPRIKSARPEQFQLFLGDEALAKSEGLNHA